MCKKAEAPREVLPLFLIYGSLCFFIAKTGASNLAIGAFENLSAYYNWFPIENGFVFSFNDKHI